MPVSSSASTPSIVRPHSWSPVTTSSVSGCCFTIKASDKQFVMDWTTEEHTDVPVPVTAEGPGAEALTGQHPNTYVHDVLTRAFGL